MNNNQASQWFECPPPAFEVYTSERPRDENLFDELKKSCYVCVPVTPH
jgi:hypothetical protein